MYILCILWDGKVFKSYNTLQPHLTLFTEKIAETIKVLIYPKAMLSQNIANKLQTKKMDYATTNVEESNNKLARAINNHANLRDFNCKYKYRYHNLNIYGLYVWNKIVEVVEIC